MYFIAQSCLYVVINFPRPPKPDQNMLYFSLFHITEFRKIPRQCRNSAERGKFRGSAQNSACRGKLQSLVISTHTTHTRSFNNINALMAEQCSSHDDLSKQTARQTNNNNETQSLVTAKVDVNTKSLQYAV